MNLGIFFEQVPDTDGTWWEMLASGLGWTLGVSFFAWIIAFTLGSIVGVVRTTDKPWLVRIGTAYVELFRNIPLIVQFFIWYFVVPGLIPAVKLWVVTLDPTEHQFVTSIVCLGLFTSARIAEQVRSGIASLSRGQRNASLALGLTSSQSYRYVILPMAFRIIVPPLTTEFVNVFQNSAVASTIGLLDLAGQGRQLVDYTARPYESFIAVTLLYCLLNVAVMMLMRWIERRVRVPGFIGSK